jgi:hypothetical protein
MVLPHQKINEGDVLVILEAMKMETEIKAARSGVVASVSADFFGIFSRYGINHFFFCWCCWHNNICGGLH